jgi:hypothetical protein
MSTGKITPVAVVQKLRDLNQESPALTGREQLQQEERLTGIGPASIAWEAETLPKG